MKTLIVVTAFALRCVTSFSQFYVQPSSGYVGVGTTSPSQLFDVNGTSRLRNVIPASNNSYDLGSSSYAMRNIYADGQIFLDAGRISIKSTNILIGNPFTIGTTGAYNCFFGGTAGTTNTTGSYNVFLNGGSNNTTGNYNIFIGTSAGDNNTTGSHNVAIGTAGIIGGPSGLSETVAIGRGAYSNVNYGIVFGSNNSLVGIRQNSPAYPLHVQNAYCNGSTWVNASDENLKENFAVIGKEESILSKVLEMPIEYWNYKGEKKPSRHIGPTAQDFYNLFKVGDNDKSISTVDAAGVAFAAIQELAHRTEKLEQIIAEQHNLISNLLNTNPSASNLLSRSSVQLHQNTPNPFTRDTEIRMTIPDDVSSATLFIYDLRGNQVKKIQLTQRGNVSATIEGRNLSAGIYFYSLIADNEVAGTKRMILTD